MIPIDQKYLHDPDNHSIGDCWRACIASVLELPIDDVPHFGAMDIRQGRIAELRFLAKHGYLVYTIYGIGTMSAHPKILEGENEYYFAIGPSPRNKTITHQVVCHEGQIIHDPHPDKSGLTGINYFEILLKLLI